MGSRAFAFEAEGREFESGLYHTKGVFGSLLAVPLLTLVQMGCAWKIGLQSKACTCTCMYESHEVSIC